MSKVLSDSWTQMILSASHSVRITDVNLCTAHCSFVVVCLFLLYIFRVSGLQSQELEISKQDEDL